MDLSGGHKVVLAQYSILPSPQLHLASSGTMVPVGYYGRPRANSDDLAGFGRSTTTYARAQSRCRALVFNIHTILRCCGLQSQATSSNGGGNIHGLGMQFEQTGLALRRWIQEVVSAPLSALAHLPAYAMQ